jgi:uncharacterized protein (TIGR03437 family)
LLRASDGAPKDKFGTSVALSGNRALVGAPGPDEGERSKGAAYIFEPTFEQSQPWVQRAKLVADDGQNLDHFGHSVALSGATALVGAPGKVLNAPLRRQAAYVFVASSTSGEWSLQDRLILGEGHPLLLSVALNGDTAVIGSSGENIDGRVFQGAALVFMRSGAVWTPQQQIIASDGEADNRFGVSVAVSGDTIMVGAIKGGPRLNQGAIYTWRKTCSAPMARLTSVSAASYTAADGLAPESMSAVFGVNLATETQAASSLPLPTTLAGVSLKVTDSAGTERLASLFFVSPGQINYLIPAGTITGQATLTVTNADGAVASGEAQIAAVAPGLFSANASGQGVANAFVLRVKANGAQSYEPVAQFDSMQKRFVPAPIDLGSATDRVFLVLYGTGLRFRSSLSAVSCSIGGASSQVLFAGAVPGYVGLDQVNVRLPRTLAGRGEVDVALFVEGKAANTVRISIR